MGCKKCGRNKKKSGTRVKRDLPTKKMDTQKISPSLASSQLLDRKKKCSNCPFKTSSGITGRCKKGNRMIAKAIIDPNFKCPIKRF